MRPYSYNQRYITCKSWLKAYNAMHLLPQITVTAVLMTDKTLHLRHSLVKNIVTPFELDFHIMLSARFWYNTNADDAVLLNYWTADRWPKRLMHMAHLSGNTSGVSKSSSDWLNYTGFPGDVCVAFFNVRLETKMLWCQTPSRKKKAVMFTNVTTSTYQDQLNAGFQKYVKYLKFAA